MGTRVQRARANTAIIANGLVPRKRRHSGQQWWGGGAGRESGNVRKMSHVWHDLLAGGTFAGLSYENSFSSAGVAFVKGCGRGLSSWWSRSMLLPLPPSGTHCRARSRRGTWWECSAAASPLHVRTEAAVLGRSCAAFPPAAATETQSSVAGQSAESSVPSRAQQATPQGSAGLSSFWRH